MGLDVLICVPEIAINMLKSVSLKIAKMCPKMAISTDRKMGVSIVSDLEGSPVCTHFFVKYECFLGMSRNVPKCAIIIDKYDDMSVSTLHLMTSHCGPRYARMCAWNVYNYAEICISKDS